MRKNMAGVFEYRECSDGLVITGYSDKHAASLTIPEMLDGERVYRIGEKAFANMLNLQKVRFENPYSNIRIDSSVFHNCRNLADITLPQAGYHFFDYKITEIGLEAKEKNLYSSADDPCKSYRWLLDAFDTDHLQIEPGFTGIWWNAFKFTKGLKEVELPPSLRDIKPGAFKNSALLEKISIPDAVLEIPDEAFAECTSLKEVIFPHYLKKIGCSAFENCSSLETFAIPDGVTTLAGGLFCGCTSLKTLFLGKDVRELGNDVLTACISLREVLIHPDNRNFVSDKTGLFSPDRKILYAAFSPDSEVYHVPDGVTFIYQAAFCVNQHFRFIVLPESLRAIGSDAFACAGCLEEISLPDQITEIPEYCFYGCESLRKIHLPEQLREIGRSAFHDCEKLSVLNVPETLYRIEPHAFAYCDELPLEIENSLILHSVSKRKIFDDDY
ncbi:MAG: leucine-rich repeat protein [Lentisphaeria bacterium]|nr:leucine-rich repeat protein [Lentisphaeria bacterium]